MKSNLNKNNFKAIFSGQDSQFILDDIVAVEFPTLTLGITEMPTTAGHVLKRTQGGSITFEPLTIDFMVDAKMDNYFWFVEWIFRNNHPETGIAENVLKQMELQLVDDKENIRRSVWFKNLTPETIPAIRFESGTGDSNYEICSVTLNYDYFSF